MQAVGFFSESNSDLMLCIGSMSVQYKVTLFSSTLANQRPYDATSNPEGFRESCPCKRSSRGHGNYCRHAICLKDLIGDKDLETHGITPRDWVPPWLLPSFVVQAFNEVCLFLLQIHNLFILLTLLLTLQLHGCISLRCCCVYLTIFLCFWFCVFIVEIAAD
jgi:hypothetical protein